MTAVFNIQGPLRNLQQAAHRPLQGRVQLSQRQKETARHDKTGGPFQRSLSSLLGEQVDVIVVDGIAWSVSGACGTREKKVT